MRLGLCCIWQGEEIRFRSTTVKKLSSLGKSEREAYCREILRHNCNALRSSILACPGHAIGSFRITSEFAPGMTHSDVSYDPYAIFPEMHDIAVEIRMMATENNVRLTTHPGQYCVLNSPREEVVSSSVREVEQTARLFMPFGVDVMILHGGGGYGDKPAAVSRLVETVHGLSTDCKKILCLENDDRVFTPEDLLPACRLTSVPMVYDVHHHRVNRDGLPEKDAWERALATWDREPLFHVSSPLGGWESKDRRSHADYIAVDDLPREWVAMDITVEVEAKAKDLAIAQLLESLDHE